MTDGDDGLASVDLSVAFFCAVLVLFVFVTFSRIERPIQPLDRTLGQPVPVLTTTVPTWWPVLRRGKVAVYSDGRFQELRLAQVLAQVEASANSVTTENGGLDWSQSPGRAVHGFRLRLGVDFGTMPEDWAGAQVALTEEAACVPAATYLVFLDEEEADIAPLLAYGERCGLLFRFEAIAAPPEDRTVRRLTIGLSPGAYARERIFR